MQTEVTEEKWKLYYHTDNKKEKSTVITYNINKYDCWCCPCFCCRCCCWYGCLVLLFLLVFVSVASFVVHLLSWQQHKNTAMRVLTTVKITAPTYNEKSQWVSSDDPTVNTIPAKYKDFMEVLISITRQQNQYNPLSYVGQKHQLYQKCNSLLTKFPLKRKVHLLYVSMFSYDNQPSNPTVFIRCTLEEKYIFLQLNTVAIGGVPRTTRFLGYTGKK